VIAFCEAGAQVADSAAEEEIQMDGPLGSLARLQRPVDSEQARTLLDEVASPLRERGIAVETVMPSGIPAETLANIASRPDIDLVVVGHRGRGAVARARAGARRPSGYSNTRYSFHFITCAAERFAAASSRDEL
jgi:nucleotide-binding universal stress UspA family protein